MNRLIPCTIIILCILAAFDLQSQTSTEAFRFSLSDPFGTARNLGVGNSMFAIGPDFSAIGSNPSGLGGYMKSEFLITAGFGNSHFNSSLALDRSNELTGNFGKVTLPNIGFIIHTKPNFGLWNSSNWAIGLNRVADYEREIQYAGNTLGSITDKWRENATGIAPDDLNGFEEGLAYTSGAIYDFEEDNIYEADYGMNNPYPLFKQESAFTEGGKSELFIAYGADLNQKLMVGFSFGLPMLNYTELRNYQEIDGADNGVPFFNELEYNSSINSTGFGWNAKLGVTVKPVKHISIALAVHTPTWLSLSDNFNTTLSYDFTDQNHDGPILSESPYGSFQYSLKTPWSTSAGIGIIAGQRGFVAAHAKLTDYSSMKYNFRVRGNGNEYVIIEREVNADIRSTYGTALQLNLGGELVIEAFRVRGGVTMQQSAFSNDHTFDPSLHFGTGYRSDHFYIDLGYKFTKQDEGYLPYETLQAPQPLVVTDYKHHLISATLGLKF